ncbi:MAG TPA: sigma-70 family RNA polymerase sigma factor [Actinoplanes sp.]|nr:sigma-70 family RNA polymerase sigma factor [Actinoplanes sp.]
MSSGDGEVGNHAHQGDAGDLGAVTEISADLPELVAAARAGDRAAAETLLAAHLPALYRIVGRALDGHADVDDVVQETVLRAYRDLPDLRAPDSFRSWLIAIAMRQISSRLRGRRREQERTAALDDAARIADPEADFADVTLLRLGLSAQRRQVGRAAAWLDPGDRELAALWWQELTGGRTRAEVVAALGIGAAHTRVRLQRMRNRLEQCRLLVAALEAEPACPALEALTDGWNGQPSPRWRKRFARHLRACDTCAPARSGLVPLERLLLGGTLTVPPAAATDPLTTAWFTPAAGAKVAAVVTVGAVVSGGILAGPPDVVMSRPLAAPSTATGRVVIRPADSPDAVVDLDGDRLVLTTGTPGAAVTMVPGLADQTCHSLRYADGRYVRHASFRLVLSAPEDSRLFREDATFCTRPGTAPATIRFTSLNYSGRFVRTVGRELRLEPAEPGATYLSDSTFVLTAP